MTDDTPSTESTADTDVPAGDGEEKLTDRTVLDGLEAHAIPLETTDPSADLGDLAPLRDDLADARVVGLGEATHGTREFFRLKHRFLRYLVTELDVRAFALEANFAETLALDEYVVHGIGDPEDALEGIYFWTWNVESVLELVEWLREFNATRPLDDRVRFYGFDAQYTRGAVEALRDYFRSVDPDALASIRDDLETLDDGAVPPQQDDRLADRIEAADQPVREIREALDDRRDDFIERPSESAWKLARQHLRTVEQAIEYQRAVRDFQDDSRGDDADERLIRVRDRSMYENVEWIIDHLDADRLALWAHDGHLNRVEGTFRETGASATSLGGHLADRYGDDYYALGFSFGRGDFQAISGNPDAEDDQGSYALRRQTLDAPLADTIDATLSELGYPLVVVNLRTARTDERLSGWLATPRSHFSVGAMYDPDDPEAYVTEYAYDEAFDAVCYVEETTRARPIERD